MRRSAVILCSVVALAGIIPGVSTACGDKFLVPGAGPGLCSINMPPKRIAVLTYGNSGSAAVTAVSEAKFKKTLSLVGYKVTTCSDPSACSDLMKAQKFDVVLADRNDADAAKKATGATVVSLLFKATREEVAAARATYGQAFDADKGSLRILPVINDAAQHGMR